MCGIAGLISTKPLAELQPAIARMVTAIRHRGPDGFGDTAISLPNGQGHVMLGQSRLAVLDLSDSARQPMRDAENGNWLVYNGELYNYRDVRRDLEKKGHNFTSSGDTEVVLRALGEWGEEAFSRFEGMYAIAFWDDGSKELMLARDPYGIKPLIYSVTPDSILFASELRSLRASGISSWSLDHDAIDSFLYYGAVIAPRTVLREARLLVAGTVLRISAERRIHGPRPIFGVQGIFPDAEDPRAGSFTDSCKRVDELLAQAVDSQLVSDVPLGIALSGGIDSTLIASHAAESKSRPDLRLLTIDTEERGYSEGHWAQQLARKLHLPHHVERLSPADLLEMLPMAISAMDQPTVDGVNVFIISAIAARRGIRVLLSGLGGDEIFAGYTTFSKVPRLYRHAKALRIGASLVGKLPLGRRPQINKVAEAYPAPSFMNAYLLQRAIRWRSSLGFLSSLPPGPPDASALPPETEEMLQRTDHMDDYRHVSALESKFYMRNQLLRDADIFSSAHGVEMRVPMLDTRLDRFALSLPARHHLRGTSRKRILRHLVGQRHGWSAAHRPKMGFVLPWNVWLRGEMYDEIAGTLLDKSSYEMIGVDVTQAGNMLKAFMSGDKLVPWEQVWSLYALVKTVNRITQ